jgi:serine/threonine protein kinase/tetratricopeptide (TPR) repeat protein
MTTELGTEEWTRLSPLLDQALDLAPGSLEPWLADLAARSPELAAMLRDLLMEKAKVDTSGFMEVSPVAPTQTATLAGQRIGAYEIENLVGQGGMGSVWLAHRCDGRFEGKAAVKFLNAGLIGGPAEQRFIREGHVLAALQHPNIAHLIDAGVSADGQPYLILEHVQGSSIDEYCDEMRLGVRQRVRVFLAVLDAVGYAHQHLVVHRDIKPSNILVTADGNVKLLDFGIAALLEPESKPRQCTREIGTALTPEYAAPEQLRGQAVTTASDVFALGRVLYVLLGGSRAAKRHEQSPADILRNTLECVPPLLSEVAVDGYKRLLRGDLDNIVAKALKIEPIERYATVEAFADDLRRYLANEPVSARPDSLGYRVGKFVRRHRGGVLSGAVSALALVLVTGFAVMQMVEARQQRNEAEAARQRAEGFSTAMTSLLSQTDQNGGPLRPEELLGRAVLQVEATYADDPPFLVHMLLLISGRYFDLQDTNQEYATLVKAERVARASGDPSLLVSVQCSTVETDLAAGRQAEARARLDEALGLLTVIGNVPPLDHAACLRAQSEIARTEGDMPAAIAYLEEARQVLEQGGFLDGNIYGGILSMLRAYHSEAGNVLIAHEYSVKLVELDKSLGRQDSMPGMIARTSLASSFRDLGQLQEAYRVHLDAGAAHTTAGPVKIIYGELLALLGFPDRAIPLIRDGMVEMDEGGNQRFRIRARLALSQSQLLASRFDEANAALDEAIALMPDEVAHGHALLEAERLRIAILTAQGKLDDAEQELADALNRHASGGFGEPSMARLLLVQARLELARGMPPDAAESARAAAEIFGRHTIDPEQSADVGEALLALAQAESAMGRPDAASAHYATANTSLSNGLGHDHPLTLLGKRLAAEVRQVDST